MNIRQSLKPAALAALAVFWASPALADGMVSGIVNSPLSAAGLVRDAHSGINVLLQSPSAPGLEFMDPAVIGYGIPAGGRIEIEMGEGFERVFEVPLTQKTIMVVTGAPQQGMPGAKVGYEIDEGETQQIIVIRPSDPAGLAAETLMSPAPGAKGDPVRQRGIKVFHIGFLESAFVNKGDRGSIEVRLIDGAGKVVERGSASVDFIARPVPQIQPTNLPNRQRNHNWQAAKSGQSLGKTPGTLPLAVNLYAAAKGVAAEEMVKFKRGLTGVGVLSTQQLKAMDFTKPEEIARYNGGLILQDANGDGILDPSGDRIIGGVIGKAPAGAKGQELKSLEVHGARDHSKPASAYNPRIGKRFGGAIALLQFTAGDKPGLYRPTLALLSDPDDLKSGDGASYTFTIVVE
jgi:hypothetical protein